MPRRSAKYKFIEFVRPGCFWPTPYSIEQAFGVFRWMVETGRPYHAQGRWGTVSIYSLLSCKPTCVSFNEIEPIVSLDDLRQRFHYALLYDAGKRLQEWRADFGVDVNSSRIITFPHHEPYASRCSGMTEAEIKGGSKGLLASSGRLTVQLNKYHRHAKNILGVELHLGTTWKFVLKYGYDGSQWYYTLSRQTRGETFVAAFNRAVKELSRLTDPLAVQEPSHA